MFQLLLVFMSDHTTINTNILSSNTHFITILILEKLYICQFHITHPELGPPFFYCVGAFVFFCSRNYSPVALFCSLFYLEATNFCRLTSVHRGVNQIQLASNIVVYLYWYLYQITYYILLQQDYYCFLHHHNNQYIPIVTFVNLATANKQENIYYYQFNIHRVCCWFAPKYDWCE